MKVSDIISKIVKGEKAILALTALVKFIAALIVAIPIIIAGFKGIKKVMLNRWSKQRLEETRFVSDSLWKAQLMNKLNYMEIKVDSISDDTKEMKGVQTASVRAINRHLAIEKKWQEQIQFQNDQIEELKKNETR